MTDVSVSTCLWFDAEAEAAVDLYVSLVPGSRVTGVSYAGAGGPLPEGAVLTVTFELAGRPFLAFNGGPRVRFNEAASIMVGCATQAEIDRLWDGLLQGGGRTKACGWLEDRYGLSWQIVPDTLMAMMTGPDRAAAARTMTALMGMVKLDMAALEAAWRGEAGLS